VQYGEEKQFLAPLSVKRIPLVGPKTYHRLQQLGIERIKTLQEMPVELLQSALGKNGRTIWLRANGIDNSPIIPLHERKSNSMEGTFNKAIIDMDKLKTYIQAMTESLSFQLRQGNKLTSVVSVRIRYSDYKTQVKQLKIPYTNADHILIPKALRLFHKLYQRRVLIRLIGVRFSGLVGGHYQISLFDDSEKMLNLYQSLDKIKNKYGERSIYKASTMHAHSIARMSNPFNGEPPVLLAHRKR